MDRKFIRALRENDTESLRKIPKGNMHSHSGKGCTLSYVRDSLPPGDIQRPDRFADLSDMQSWYYRSIGRHLDSRKGLVLRWEGCFAEARDDSLEVMVQSFSAETVAEVGGMSEFIRILEGFKKDYCPDILFIPEITFPRSADIRATEAELDELLAYDYFKAVDICFDEKSRPVDAFSGIYRKCMQAGLIPKAHVGEFGEPEDVVHAVRVLGLREIYHGIAAARSEKVMDYLKANDIILNICPTSNVCLGAADSYETHPIRKLFDAGITVTVNTDDLLIFQASVSDEYMNLYRCGLMEAEELDAIRCNSLKDKVTERYGM